MKWVPVNNIITVRSRLAHFTALEKLSRIKNKLADVI